MKEQTHKRLPHKSTASLKARYFLGAVVGRLTGSAMRKSTRSRRPIQVVLFDSFLSSRLSHFTSLTDSERKKVENELRDTTYWHGSGRYQYRHGEITDVLTIILKCGFLRPQPDPFDKTGPMESVSLARARIYARAYADMHGKGAHEANRHGSSAFWASVFVGDYAIEAAKEQGGLKKALGHLRNNGSHAWHAKINKNQLSIIRTFYQGSDIAGNYPILFGIKQVKKVAVTSRAIAIHEVRSIVPISLAGISHIEVPLEKVTATKRVLAAHDVQIPVYAIEDFERYAAEHRFSELLK